MIPENNYKYIDLETIYEMADGEDEFVINIIGAYLSSIPDSLAKLVAAAAAGNLDDIIFYVHKLKGSYNFIGCTDLTELLAEIEDICLVKNGMDKIPGIVTQVNILSEAATAELNDVLTKIGS